MMPCVSTTWAPAAPGRPSHAVPAWTQVIVSPSTSTSPSNVVSGTTTVPLSRIPGGAASLAASAASALTGASLVPPSPAVASSPPPDSTDASS